MFAMTTGFLLDLEGHSQVGRQSVELSLVEYLGVDLRADHIDGGGGEDMSEIRPGSNRRFLVGCLASPVRA